MVNVQLKQALVTALLFGVEHISVRFLYALTGAGFIVDDYGKHVLSKEGYAYANQVLSELIAAVEHSKEKLK